MPPTSINKDTIRPHTLSKDAFALKSPHGKFYLDDDREIFSRIRRTRLFQDEEGLPYKIAERGLVRSKSDDVIESYYTLDDKRAIRMGIPVFVQLGPKKRITSAIIHSHFELGSVPDNKCGTNRDSWTQWMMTHGSLSPSHTLYNEDTSIMSEVRAVIPGIKVHDKQSNDTEGYIEDKMQILFDLVIRPKLGSVPEVFDDGSERLHRSDVPNPSIGYSDTCQTHPHLLTLDSVFRERS